MGCFGICGVVEVEAFIGEEMGLADAGVFPGFPEPRDAFLPVEECFKWGQVRVFAEDMRDRLVGLSEKGEKAFGERFGEFGFTVAFRDVARFVFREGTKPGEGRRKVMLGHSGEKA